MAEGGCARCGTIPPPGARFCTGCGVALGTRPAAAVPGVHDDPAALQLLVECDACGAGNAASRALCARCGAPMRDEIPGGDALPDAVAPSHDALPPGVRGEGPTLLLALVILAGLITAGVLLALVTSRVTTPDATVPTGLALQSAVASSSLDDHPPSLVIDGDPATAWTEGTPGAGEGEWVEVALADASPISQVLIWNGDQATDSRFDQNGRAASVRIELGDRQFRVALRDIPGPQAIDLPTPVTASRVRVVVEEAVAGSRYTDLAISEIVVRGPAE